MILTAMKNVWNCLYLLMLLIGWRIEIDIMSDVKLIVIMFILRRAKDARWMNLFVDGCANR